MATKEVVCLGCGDDYAGSRNMSGTYEAERIQKMWKVIIAEKIAERSEDIGISCDDLLDEFGVMCKSCYSRFDRYSRLHNTIMGNLNHLMEKLSLITVTCTRQKVRRVVSFQTFSLLS